MKEYLELAARVMEEGRLHENRTGINTIRVIGGNLNIDISNSFPLLTTKKVSLKNVFTELKFFLLGRTDYKWMEERGCKIWGPWATEEWCSQQGLQEGDLGPIYGFQWRHFGAPYSDFSESYEGKGYDQLKRAVEGVLDRSTSRRLLVSAWNPLDLHKMALPPCHVLFHFIVDEGLLHICTYQRSVDVFLGLPYNIASYALLTYMVSHVAGLTPGTLNMNFGDVHIYENHIEQIKTQLTRKPIVSPTLVINKKIDNPSFEALLDIEWEDLQLVCYQHHGVLKGEIAV